MSLYLANLREMRFPRIAFLLIGLIIWASPNSFSQNLVPNSSFEEHSEVFCGFFFKERQFTASATGWNYPNKGTSEILSDEVDKRCMNSTQRQSEQGFGGTAPRTGKAMAGLTVFDNTGLHPDYREYLQVQLNSPLEIGAEYEAGFWIKMAPNSPYAVSHMGLALTMDPINDPSNYYLPIKPKVEFTSIINATDDWMHVTGRFIADAPFQNLLIGNFRGDFDLDIEEQSDNSYFSQAYYYVDDVSLRATGEKQNILIAPNAFTPNGDGLNDDFKPLGLGDMAEYEFQVFDHWGKLIFKSQTPNEGWDGKQAGKESPLGNYVWSVKYESPTQGLQSKHGVVTLIR